MAAFIYRLQLLLEQKEEIKKEAERSLVQAEKELQSQVERLHALQQTVKELVEKRLQMQRELLKPAEGGALNARTVQERIEYSKAVGLQIEDAQSDVNSQHMRVEQCETDVRENRKRMQEANREMEILQKHRAKQQERFQRELREEDLELDEIGNVLFMTRRRSL